MPKKINIKKELKILNENQKLTKVKRAWKNLTKTQQNLEYQNFENFKKIYFEENNFKDINKKDPNSSSEGVGTGTKLFWWISGGAVGFILLLMFMGSGGNNSGTSYNKPDYLMHYRNTSRNGEVYVRCTYQSGKIYYVKYFYGVKSCKDDLNN